MSEEPRARSATKHLPLGLKRRKVSPRAFTALRRRDQFVDAKSSGSGPKHVHHTSAECSRWRNDAQYEAGHSMTAHNRSSSGSTSRVGFRQKVSAAFCTQLVDHARVLCHRAFLAGSSKISGCTSSSAPTSVRSTEMTTDSRWAGRGLVRAGILPVLPRPLPTRVRHGSRPRKSAPSRSSPAGAVARRSLSP